MLLERATLPDGSPAFDRAGAVAHGGRAAVFGAALRVQLLVLVAIAALAARARPDAATAAVPRGLLAGALATLGDRHPRRAVHPARLRPVLHAVPRGVLRGRLVALLDDRHADPRLPRALWATSRSSPRRSRWPGGRSRWPRVVVAPRARAGAPVIELGARDARSSASVTAVRRISRPRTPSARSARPWSTASIWSSSTSSTCPAARSSLAHSDRLEEVSHGAASGSVRTRTLDELRRVAPELPTLDEALAFFVAEAPEVGLHVDLKLTTRLDELAAALAPLRCSSDGLWSPRSTCRAAARSGIDAPTVRIGFTYPEDRLGVSRRPALRPIVQARALVDARDGSALGPAPAPSRGRQRR